MFRYDPAADAHEQFYQGEIVGGFTIQDDGALLLFMHAAPSRFGDGELTTILTRYPTSGSLASTMSSPIPKAALFCGTMPTPTRAGRLYRLDPDRTLTLLLEAIGVSNGMGLTPDRKQLYFTDTARARSICSIMTVRQET